MAEWRICVAAGTVVLPEAIGCAIGRMPLAEAEQEAAQRWPWLSRENCAHVVRECAQRVVSIDIQTLAPDQARSIARLPPPLAHETLAARWPQVPAEQRETVARECRGRHGPWLAQHIARNMVRLRAEPSTSDVTNITLRLPHEVHTWSLDQLCDYMVVLGVDLPAGDLVAAAAAILRQSANNTN